MNKKLFKLSSELKKLGLNKESGKIIKIAQVINENEIINNLINEGKITLKPGEKIPREVKIYIGILAKIKSAEGKEYLDDAEKNEVASSKRILEKLESEKTDLKSVFDAIKKQYELSKIEETQPNQPQQEQRQQENKKSTDYKYVILNDIASNNKIIIESFFNLSRSRTVKVESKDATVEIFNPETKICKINFSRSIIDRLRGVEPESRKIHLDKLIELKDNNKNDFLKKLKDMRKPTLIKLNDNSLVFLSDISTDEDGKRIAQYAIWNDEFVKKINNKDFESFYNIKLEDLIEQITEFV